MPDVQRYRIQTGEVYEGRRETRAVACVVSQNGKIKEVGYQVGGYTRTASYRNFRQWLAQNGYYQAAKVRKLKPVNFLNWPAPKGVGA